MRRIILIIGLALAAHPGAAQEAGRDSGIAGLFEVAASYGGDEAGVIEFVGGEQQSIKTGNGLTVAGGISHAINERFGVKYVAGYKMSFSRASNADVMKSAIPIDIVPYYVMGSHRVGLGLSHHLSPKIDWDWLAPTTRFDDATGLTLEYSYSRFSFSYTHMNYKAGGVSLDANHFSAKFGLTF